MQPERKQQLHRTLSMILSLILTITALWAHYRYDPWGFYWKVSEAEADLRLNYVKEAQKYLGYSESDGTHRQIIDLYNSHEPLAVGYTVQYTDSWCSTFVSCVSIECSLTEIIPTECGCERQIGLFQKLGTWVEDDAAIPLPGDLIFYDWNMEEKGECTGWSDHVGIVVGTKWPFVKVIEGNYNDCVAYRYLLLNDIQIRGYAKPDYPAYLNENTP